MSQFREAEIHRLIGGALCLDFANTLNGHGRPSGHEYLHGFRDLVLWSRHAAVITPNEARMLLQEAEARPAAAAGIFRKALALREAIFRIFAALASGRRPEENDLNELNAAWREGQRHARVVPSSNGFDLRWDDDPALERIARSASASAISLLTSDKVRQVRACAGEQCDWLFVDQSRNHLRRWCSMDECGNRSKMKRRQQRKKALEVK
jgi:predicted RNA-binding Zn ribbon-like protein